MTERDPKVFVVVESWHYFTLWCQIDCNPPQNPRDRKFVVITNWDDAMRRVSGLRWQEGDQCVWLGDVRHGSDIFHFLRHRGMPKNYEPGKVLN